MKQADYPAAEEALKSFHRDNIRTTRWPAAPNTGWARPITRADDTRGGQRLCRGLQALSEGDKAADDLLKLGMSLARANQKQNACVALAQLDHDFPNPGSAIKERAVAEKKRLGC